MRAALLVLVACSASPARIAIDNAPPARTGPSIEERLDALAVTDDDFYRAVLYTWTTPDSAATLRRSHRLLVATASSGGFTSPFNRALASYAKISGEDGEVAKMLANDPRLIRRRYAWPAPYATVMGVGNRTYGNALVRIELRPEAWIGRFQPGAEVPFTFVDADHRELPLADVLASPERVGAIFHVQPFAEIPFREYVVCNPAMVASWSVATPQIRDVVDDEVDLLLALREAAPLDGRQLVAWRAALAFDNARYRPEPERLDAIVATMADYDGSGAPLEFP